MARVECSKYCPYNRNLLDIQRQRREENYGQELDVGTHGGDTREEGDIHAGGVKWKKKRQNV